MKKLISLKLVGILLALSASGVNAQVLCGMQQPGQPCSMAVMPMMMYGSVQAGVQGGYRVISNTYNVARNVAPLPKPYYHSHNHQFDYNIPHVVNWNYGSGPHYQVGVYVKGISNSVVKVQVPAFPPQHSPVFFR